MTKRWTEAKLANFFQSNCAGRLRLWTGAWKRPGSTSRTRIWPTWKESSGCWPWCVSLSFGPTSWVITATNASSRYASWRMATGPCRWSGTAWWRLRACCKGLATRTNRTSLNFCHVLKSISICRLQPWHFSQPTIQFSFFVCTVSMFNEFSDWGIFFCFFKHSFSRPPSSNWF